jgi:peptidoglycan/LPS O-acetylase OafA/YrhL
MPVISDQESDAIKQKNSFWIRQKPRGLKPEIQFLRMVAVIAVFLCHLFPNTFVGGFVGVDVFFIISGYLITSKILREIKQTGSFSMSKFWANRARRILPAGLFCIGVTAIFSYIFLPISWAKNIFEQGLASIFYVQNWYLANTSVAYQAKDQLETPFHHLWSLGIEEQFYLVLPLMVVVALGIGAVFVRKMRLTPDNSSAVSADLASDRSLSLSIESSLDPQPSADIVQIHSRNTNLVVLIFLAVATIVSFAYNIFLTSGSGSNDIYFMTTTRGWELGLGALLSFVPFAVKRGSLKLCLFGAGIIVIVLGVFGINFTLNFPGWVALIPALGAIAVIVSSMESTNQDNKHLERNSIISKISEALINFPLFQFIGNISYSLYLWHWVVIVLYPWVKRDFELGPWDNSAIFLTAFTLAVFSYYIIENPIRFSSYLQSHTAKSLIGAMLVMFFLSGVLYIPYANTQSQIEEFGSLSDVVLPNSEQGASYMFSLQNQYGIKDKTNLEDSILRSFDPSFVDQSSTEIIPNPLSDLYYTARTPLEGHVDGECDGSGKDETPVCVYAPFDNPTKTIALIGDSQIEMFFEAFAILAREYNWEIQSYLHTQCPFLPVGTLNHPLRKVCVEANDKTVKKISESKPDLAVIMSFITPLEGQDKDPLVGEKGLSSYLKTFVENGVTTVLFNGIPRPPTPWSTGLDQPMLQCVFDNLENPQPCVFSPTDFREHQFFQEVHRMNPEIPIIDLNDSTCINYSFEITTAEDYGKIQCYYVIGNVLAFRDYWHFSAQYAVSLIPYFEPQLLQLLGQ